MTRRAASLSLALACAAGATPGNWLSEGPARALLPSGSGASLAFLQRLEHPQGPGIPDDLYRGDLMLSRGRARAVQLGSGVPDLPGAVAFEPGGEALAFLAAFRVREGAGELWVARPGSAPQRLAGDAGSFAWSPRGGSVAYVAQGTLHVVPGPGRPAAPDWSPVQGFAWSPDGSRLLARSPAQAQGRLAVLEDGKWRAVAPASSDFAFAPDGALAVLGLPGPKGGDRPLSLFEPGSARPRELGKATSFDLAPDGSAVALLSTGKTPGEASGDLSLAARAGAKAPRPLGTKVSAWRWSAASDLLYLARFDLRSRAGVLYALTKGAQQPRELAARVQSFSASGRRAFYLVQHPQKKDYTIELWTLDLGSPPGSPQAAPRKVDDGVYGYQLSRDGALLYWKSHCVALRSCALFRAPADGSAAPVELLPQVAGFDLSRDGARLLAALPHHGSRALDLAVLDARGPAHKPPPAPAISSAEPGALFLDEGGRRLAAATSGPGRGGVLLVELP